MTTIDLNADLGESFGPWRLGNDEAVLEIVSSANVACGFHASDPLEMLNVVRLAAKNKVGIGAHPGFQDLQGFGRRRIEGIPPDELTAIVTYQIGALQAIAAQVGERLQHVKIHGALNNMASERIEMARPCLEGLKQLSDPLIVMALPGTEMERACEELNLPIAREVFADRAYNDDGNLVQRGTDGAMITDASEAADNMLAVIEDHEITSITGKKIKVVPDTICVHGDKPHTVKMLQGLRKKLEDAGIKIRRLNNG